MKYPGLHRYIGVGTENILYLFLRKGGRLFKNEVVFCLLTALIISDNQLFNIIFYCKTYSPSKYLRDKN